jgi:signal transduction histidine kinase
MSQHVNKAAMRLYHLIENYLVYAQIEIAVNEPGFSNRIKVSKTEDPRIVMEDQAIQKAQEYNREADLKLEIQELPPVRIMEDYLKKMIEELVDNAFKFSEAGKNVYVTVSRSGNHCVIQVTDYGRGMTSEQVTDIGAYMQFNRKFYEQQGSGLGLVIARRITEIHGGRLSIESIPNQQTSITVKLPLALQDQ